MKMNEFLGAIVAGCLMVIAFAIVTNPENRGEIYTRPLPVVVYTPVEPLPVREVVEVDERQLECMALNMYFEARNQDTAEAMAAVGYTVLNRVTSSRYPDTICVCIVTGKQIGRAHV